MTKIKDAAGYGLALASGNPLGAAVVAFGVLEDHVKQWREERVARWWKRLTEDPSWETPQEAQGIIEAALQESADARETVWTAAKELIDAVDLEAVEVIGSITAEYLRDKRQVDVFFRGSVRMLADLSSVELRALRVLVTAVDQVPDDPILVIEKEGRLNIRKVSSPNPVSQGIEIGDVRRLFRMVKANDLGDEPQGGKYDSPTGPTVLVPNKAHFHQLSRHLGSVVIGGNRQPTTG